MDILMWLQDWYKQQCDGFWEHLYGIEIGNIDNPGWEIKIDLKDTPYEDEEFLEINIQNNDQWMICEKQKSVFKGYGSYDKLFEILTVFKNWIESQS